MDNPLVSVCIPVYNSENTIRQTIESALLQTYKNIEIIVVDNNSADNTWSIISSFADNRIRKYKNNTNIGMVANWNKCLEYAVGKYIHFLCGDDIILSECISKKVELAESDEDIALVFSASQIINEKNKVVLCRRPFKNDCIIDGKRLAKKSFLEKNIYGEPSNVLFKRELLKKTNGFSSNLIYAIEWEMWIRLSFLGNVGYISEPLMKYRISASNATSHLTNKKMQTDDAEFIMNLEAANISFSKAEKFKHKFMVMMRMYARNIFMRLRSQ